MLKLLLGVWRSLPLWIHLLVARLVRRRFRVAVAALIYDGAGRVLLFKHTYRKFEWGIPAGMLERYEQPADAVAREFLEESGIQIQVQGLLTAISAREDHHITLVYLCRMVGDAFKPSLEISEMSFFDVNELPGMLYAEKDLVRRFAHLSRGVSREASLA